MRNLFTLLISEFPHHHRSRVRRKACFHLEPDYTNQKNVLELEDPIERVDQNGHPVKPFMEVHTKHRIPKRKTTRIAFAKFISKCHFAHIDFLTLGGESLLLPIGDILTRTENVVFTWDGVTWRRSLYTSRNKVAALYYLENIHYFVGLMGIFSFHFNYGKQSFYVNYGNEKSGILYGLIWLGPRAYIVQSCGEKCALWCDIDEKRMWQRDGWVV